jgi:hypothetical protein
VKPDRPASLRSARSAPSLNGLLPTSWARSIYRDPALPFASLRRRGVRYSVREKTLFFPNRPLQPDRSLAD